MTDRERETLLDASQRVRIAETLRLTDRRNAAVAFLLVAAIQLVPVFRSVAAGAAVPSSPWFAAPVATAVVALLAAVAAIITAGIDAASAESPNHRPVDRLFVPICAAILTAAAVIAALRPTTVFSATGVVLPMVVVAALLPRPARVAVPLFAVPAAAFVTAGLLAAPPDAFRVAALGNGLLGAIAAIVVAHAAAVNRHARLADAELLDDALHRAEYLARHDPMTDLPDRRAFQDAFDRELAAARRHRHHVSLMLLDIDGFRAINDAHGHAVGDRLLTRVAQAIRETVRDVDLPARWGGDEFVVLLPYTHRDAATTGADRLRRAVETVTVESENGASVGCTVSIGVAAVPLVEVHPLESAYLAAGRARTRAKTLGGNRVDRDEEDTMHRPALRTDEDEVVLPAPE